MLETLLQNSLRKFVFLLANFLYLLSVLVAILYAGKALQQQTIILAEGICLARCACLLILAV